MTPAEQGQEADERRWTIYKSDDERFPEDCRVDGPPTTDHPEEEVEVVPASELEMCQRYFPFMQRSRADYKRRLEECQQSRDATQAVRAELEEGLARCERERDAAGVEADEQRRERQAAETARDEAVKREKALRAAIEEHRDRDTFKSTKAEANRKLYAALDQSGKGARS